VQPTIDPTGLRHDENGFTATDYRCYGWFMILLGLGGIVAGGVVLHANWRTLQVLIRGPVPVTLAQLRKAESPDELPSPWVSLSSSQIIDTHVRRHVGRRGVELRYVLVPVEDRFLLTEVHWSFKPGSRLTGYLTQWEPNRNGGGILQDVQAGRHGDRLLPYQMCAVSDGGGHQQVMVALGPLLMLVGLLFAGLGWRSLCRIGTTRRPAWN
jgi:hypothetical protein